jgi:hypothetical protein
VGGDNAICVLKKITPGLSVGHRKEHNAITGKVNASTPISIRIEDEYFGLTEFVYRFCPFLDLHAL